MYIMNTLRVHKLHGFTLVKTNGFKLLCNSVGFNLARQSLHNCYITYIQSIGTLGGHISSTQLF